MDFKEKAELAAILRQSADASAASDWKLAVAQTAATNGRVFCLMLFVACIALYVVARHEAALKLAVIAALPVGISHTAHLFIPPHMHALVSALSAVLSIIVLSFLLTL